MAAKLPDERYLTRPAKRPAPRGRQGPTTSDRTGEQLHPPARDRRQAGGGGPAQEDPAQLRRQEEEELLRVLVTRPQVASKPRDNIVFEGDMDLRTTFETSYEALAKLRLDHWKRSRAEETAATSPATAKGFDVSDRGEQLDVRGGGEGGRGAQRRVRRAAPEETEHGGAGKAPARDHSPGDVGGGHARDASSNYKSYGPAASTRPTNAELIKPPARVRGGDSSTRGTVSSQHGRQQEQPDNLTSAEAAGKAPASSASQTAGAAARQMAGSLATGRDPQQPERRQQQQAARSAKHEPFIDPDLSPIIVYDANLDRLERVGLRKRSKYRPSTSLRPGGRAGFFGASDSREPSELPGAQQDAELERMAQDRRTTGGGKRGADPSEHGPDGGRRDLDDSSPYMFTPEPSPALTSHLHDKAAGASSEQLNRNKNAAGESGGRKHHPAHVNRVDHIKLLNLVANTDPNFKEFRDKSTLTDSIKFQPEPLAAPSQTDECQNRLANETGNSLAEDQDERDRVLAREEEAAAVAEIQRLVGASEDGPHRAVSSRQSNIKSPLAKQNTIAASPLELANNKSRDLNSQASNATEKSSRYSRQERLCQNQSFYLFDNSYPEAKSGALDDQICIKIGGRQTALSAGGVGGSQQQSAAPSPQALRVDRVKNLFRESPDFIFTTGHGYNDVVGLWSGNSVTPNQQSQAAAVKLVGPALAKTDLPEQFGDGAEISLDNLGEPEGRDNQSRHKCRVFDLGNEFEFVGSKSGHKYFVEKIHNTPVAEIS